MPPLVTLEARRDARALRRAKWAQEQVKRKRLREHTGQKHEMARWLGQRYQGYCGEEAYGQFYGIELPETDNFWNTPDVGPFEVRAAQGITGRMIVHPRELQRWPSNQPKALALLSTFNPRNWLLMGYAFIGDAPDIGVWEVYREGGGAWYIPQAYLLDLPEPWELEAFSRDPQAWRPSPSRGFWLTPSYGNGSTPDTRRSDSNAARASRRRPYKFPHSGP